MLFAVVVIEGRQYVVHEDSGYASGMFLEVPSSGSNLSDIETGFKSGISRRRVTVE